MEEDGGGDSRTWKYFQVRLNLCMPWPKTLSFVSEIKIFIIYSSSNSFLGINTKFLSLVNFSIFFF